MLARRKKIIKWFAAVYVVLIIFLIYLAFFNLGLTIEEKLDSSGTQKKLFLTNNSSKTIKNIVLSYKTDSQTIEIKKISVLKPQKSLEINYAFPKETGKIILIAEAPFYLGVSKEIVPSKSVLGLNYNIQSPTQVFSEVSFTVVFQVCNTNSLQKSAFVEEKHSQSFFSEGSNSQTVLVEPDSCENIEYVLTPKTKGDTTIYFKINVQGISEEKSLTLRVN